MRRLRKSGGKEVGLECVIRLVMEGPVERVELSGRERR